MSHMNVPVKNNLNIAIAWTPNAMCPLSPLFHMDHNNDHKQKLSNNFHRHGFYAWIFTVFRKLPTMV